MLLLFSLRATPLTLRAGSFDSFPTFTLRSPFHNDKLDQTRVGLSYVQLKLIERCDTTSQIVSELVMVGLVTRQGRSAVYITLNIQCLSLVNLLSLCRAVADVVQTAKTIKRLEKRPRDILQKQGRRCG